MCEDFTNDWDNTEDTSFDPSNDFEEDLFDEQHKEGLGKLIDPPSEDEVLANSEPRESKVDFQDAFIVGSMIAGNAYDEAVAKRRLKEIKRSKK